MIIAALLVLASVDESPVALHVEQAKDVSSAIVAACLDALRDGVREKTRRAVVTDEPVWTECRARDRCIREIEDRLRTRDLVVVRMFGGSSLMRIVVERFSSEHRVGEAELELSKESPELKSRTQAIAASLFPEDANAVHVVTTEPIARPALWPKWALLATGAGAVAVGTVLEFQHARDQKTLDGATVLDASAYRDLTMRADREAVASLLLIGSGAVILVATLVWMFLE